MAYPTNPIYKLYNSPLTGSLDGVKKQLENSTLYIPIDEFLDDDGISHIVEGGLKLKVDYEMNGRNNSCKLYASIV